MSVSSAPSFNATTFDQLKQHLQAKQAISDAGTRPQLRTLHWACVSPALRLLIQQSLPPTETANTTAPAVLDLNTGADTLGMADLQQRLLYDLQVLAHETSKPNQHSKRLCLHLPIALLNGEPHRWLHEGCGVLSAIIKQAHRLNITVHVHWHGSLQAASRVSAVGETSRAAEALASTGPLWQQVRQRWQQKRWFQLLKHATQLGHVVEHASVKHALRRLGVGSHQLVLQPLSLHWHTLEETPALIQPKAHWYPLYERLRAWKEHPNSVTFGVLGPITPQWQALQDVCYCLAELPERFNLLLLADAEGSQEEQALHQLIERLGLQQRIQWVGLPQQETLRVVLPWIDTALVLPFDMPSVSVQSVQAWWQHTGSMLAHGWLVNPLESSFTESFTALPPQQSLANTTQEVVPWMQRHRQQLEQTLNTVQPQQWQTLNTLSAVAMLLLEHQQNETPPPAKATMTELLQLASLV
ncbi:MAG: hypothetical protein ACKO34_01385 [Vampirovibrionales bacterium]